MPKKPPAKPRAVHMDADDVLHPIPSVLCKLGSVIAHMDEARGPKGHVFDMVALDALLRDPEVQGWLEGMRKLAMLPVKR